MISSGVNAKIENIIAEQFKTETVSARLINHGFYGYIYLAETDRIPRKIIVKVFKKEGYADDEQRGLDLLRKYAAVKVPEVLGKSMKTDNGYRDILFLEFIDGVNAGKAEVLTDEKEKERFANEVIENLLSIHSAENKDGFGNIGSAHFEKNWSDFYRGQIENLYNKVFEQQSGKLPAQALKLIDEIYYVHDSVFTLPIKKSVLIHGDYNLWNLLIDPCTYHLTGMLDPMGCCYADNELELIQLQKANGEKYGLLETYSKYVNLSDNFALKNEYYHFWDDVKHLANVGHYDETSFSGNGKRVLNMLSK